MFLSVILPVFLFITISWLGAINYILFQEVPFKGPVILVTAHPDDETMFFFPVLDKLREECNIHLLTFSTGM
jgi:hypothetical protein